MERREDDGGCVVLDVWRGEKMMVKEGSSGVVVFSWRGCQ